MSAWREFWLASELSEATSPGFAERINEFAPPAADAPRLVTYAAADVALERPSDSLARVAAGRRSVRQFGPAPLPDTKLGELFGAFQNRAWPSAGALYPLEVFAVLLHVDHALNGRVVHYEPDTHGLTEVGPAPSWDALRAPLGGLALANRPQVVVLFLLDNDAMEAKYGDRGGRFALIEVGHAAHALALRLAASGLVGCELGGAYDRWVKSLLGLSDTPLLVAHAYACGIPALSTTPGVVDKADGLPE